MKKYLILLPVLAVVIILCAGCKVTSAGLEGARKTLHALVDTGIDAGKTGVDAAENLKAAFSGTNAAPAQ